MDNLWSRQLMCIRFVFPYVLGGTEPMTLGSPTSPKPMSGAQFLPGFLMGDLPAPASPQPRPFSLTSPITENTSASRGQLEANATLLLL